MHKFLQAFVVLSICLVVTTGCNEDKKPVEVDPVISTFYLIRHAEKDRTDPENKDPELNQDGLDLSNTNSL